MSDEVIKIIINEKGDSGLARIKRTFN